MLQKMNYRFCLLESELRRPELSSSSCIGFVSFLLHGHAFLCVYMCIWLFLLKFFSFIFYIWLLCLEWWESLKIWTITWLERRKHRERKDNLLRHLITNTYIYTYLSDSFHIFTSVSINKIATSEKNNFPYSSLISILYSFV